MLQSVEIEPTSSIHHALTCFQHDSLARHLVHAVDDSRQHVTHRLPRPSHCNWHLVAHHLDILTLLKLSFPGLFYQVLPREGNRPALSLNCCWLLEILFPHSLVREEYLLALIDRTSWIRIIICEKSFTFSKYSGKPPSSKLVIGLPILLWPWKDSQLISLG